MLPDYHTTRGADAFGFALLWLSLFSWRGGFCQRGFRRLRWSFGLELCFVFLAHLIPLLSLCDTTKQIPAWVVFL